MVLKQPQIKVVNANPGCGIYVRPLDIRNEERQKWEVQRKKLEEQKEKWLNKKKKWEEERQKNGKNE